jgi:MoaA/NifB/PqqE/SkfB family radical SAM enzyme
MNPTLQDVFLANPDKTVAELLARRAFKGSLRETVTQTILAHQDRPDVGQYFWVLLMPRRLSLMSVAGRCNLACRMCGGSRGTLRYLTSRTLETMLKHAPFTEMVTLVAGDSEPLLNPDMASNLHAIRNHNALWDIVTNGHLLNDELIERMAADPRPSRLNVSLDACRPETYRAIRKAPLESVLSKLRALRDAKRANQSAHPLVSLLIVGMEDNIEELPQFVALAAELQAERVLLSHMLGNYSPGDFFRNPHWPVALREAAAVSRETGVRLEWPSDARPADHAAGRTTVRAEQKPIPAAEPTVGPDGPAHSQTTHAAPRSDNQGQAQAADNGAPIACCPWLLDAHIDMDGTIHPCCNVGEPIGNILESPLYRNQPYLNAKMDLMQGKLFRKCMGNLNCAYVASVRKKATAPAFID